MSQSSQQQVDYSQFIRNSEFIKKDQLKALLADDNITMLITLLSGEQTFTAASYWYVQKTSGELVSYGYTIFNKPEDKLVAILKTKHQPKQNRVYLDKDLINSAQRSKHIKMFHEQMKQYHTLPTEQQ